MPGKELDLVVYDASGERPAADIIRQIDEIRRLDGWATEGAYTEAWLAPLLDDASAIIWLDVPWQTCVLRMVKRHLRAELAGNNRHPGWGKLLSFMNYTRRTAPRQRGDAIRLLAPYQSKVLRCRTSKGVAAVKAKLISLDSD